MKYILAPLMLGFILTITSCAQEEINTEFSVTTSALPLIPAKAVSCYSSRIAGFGQTPTQDVEEDYFRIPSFTFWRNDSTKDLIISSIRITYSIPTAPGQPSAPLKCEIAGDPLRALSNTWWSGGTEAKIPANSGTPTNKFVTDCAAYCGGIKTTMENFTASGNIEIFGLERDSAGNETPVKLQGFISIQAF